MKSAIYLKTGVIFLLFALSHSTLRAQSNNQVILRIKPVNWLISQNPGITVEKALSSKFSLSLGLDWKRRWWRSNGGSWNFGEYYRSEGFSIATEGRYYLSSKKEAPFGWFLAGQYRYSERKLRNYETSKFDDNSQRTENLTRYGNEFIVSFGNQFKAGRISFESSIGLLYSDYRYDHKLLEGNLYSNGAPRIQTTEETVIPYLSLTIGYVFGDLQKASKPAKSSWE